MQHTASPRFRDVTMTQTKPCFTNSPIITFDTHASLELRLTLVTFEKSCAGDATNHTSGGQEGHQACTAIEPEKSRRSRSKRPAGVAEGVAFPEEVRFPCIPAVALYYGCSVVLGPQQLLQAMYRYAVACVAQPFQVPGSVVSPQDESSWLTFAGFVLLHHRVLHVTRVFSSNDEMGYQHLFSFCILYRPSGCSKVGNGQSGGQNVVLP